MDINMENRSRKGKLSIKATKGFRTCAIVFFENSLICVVFDKKYDKQIGKDWKKIVKENKIPLMQRNEARINYYDSIAERYAYADAEELICMSNDNFEIEYADIEKTRITPFRRNVRKAGEVNDELGEIRIKCTDNKYHFNHYYKNDEEKYIAIKQLMEEKTAE